MLTKKRAFRDSELLMSDRLLFVSHNVNKTWWRTYCVARSRTRGRKKPRPGLPNRPKGSSITTFQLVAASPGRESGVQDW